ncbi:MAG: acyl-CoA dehydrogenase [Desulfobacteraceae bacterium 4572_130]|nr:MAG: acyl-CoA dehydrogenase [Desulfobacteraceae bacterium 4572_130]
MAQLISDRRDIDFVLHEQLGLVDHELFEEFNKKTVDLIISEARNLAIKEILPTQQPGDEQGCILENGNVKVPESFQRPWKLYKEGEWLAMADDPEVGGQGMPKLVSLAANEYLVGANPALLLYSAMTHGAAKLVEAFGTKEQKKLYMKKMFSGEWGGTMLLTESEAGSDVGALTTSAEKNDDGTYSITGTKIFISGGEHNLCDNIIHPVLARIKGSPEGTKGISLFLVPKYHVNQDSSLGEFNNVICTGIEEKMGIHGNATCTLSLGEKGKTTGTLLGEINKGMPAMFKMMNEARAFVGLQGFAVASASYMYALDYAKTRIQGKNILKPKNGNVPIIQHPDVKRQLLNMKAWVDGMRSLIYFNGKCSDIAATTNDELEKEKYKDMIELLTPIVKGYGTDKALEICSHGIQIFGGYGYIKEFPVEQLMRDSRIFMLYEGTNGIQAIDLVGRKLRMKDGKLFNNFIEEIQNTIKTSQKIKGLEKITQNLAHAVSKLEITAQDIKQRMGSEKILNAFSFAHPFLEVTGDVTMAWMLLWRACVASQKILKKAGSLEKEILIQKALKNKDIAFYAGQIKTAEFFINTILPSTLGKMDAIMDGDTCVEDILEQSFGV